MKHYFRVKLMKFLSWLSFELRMKRERKRLKIAKRKAIKLHKLTGKRYHVVPNGSGGLMVVDNEFLKIYNKNVKGLGKQLTFQDLMKNSYFSTSVRGVTE